MWKVNWKSSNLVIKDGIDAGKMNVVTGEIYEKDKPASRFEAKTGEANRDTSRLELVGAVRLESLTSKAVLKANRVEWLADKKLYRASGNVELVSQSGVVKSEGTMFADAELKKIATSEEYFKRANP